MRRFLIFICLQGVCRDQPSPSGYPLLTPPPPSPAYLRCLSSSSPSLLSVTIRSVRACYLADSPARLALWTFSWVVLAGAIHPYLTSIVSTSVRLSPSTSMFRYSVNPLHTLSKQWLKQTPYSTPTSLAASRATTSSSDARS